MRSTPRRAPSDEAGFTLIEVLIATLLMTVILGALATVTSQWLPNWNRGMARVQRAERLAIGLERIAADLSVAEMMPINGDARTPLFEGSELSVTFVRTAVGPSARPGLEIVRFIEKADDRGLAMVRERAPFSPRPTDAQIRFADQVVLIREPFRLTFSYAGTDHVWLPDWRGQKQLPDTIRIAVRDGATGAVLAVSGAAVVHVNAWPQCARSKSASACMAERLKPDSGQEGGAALKAEPDGMSIDCKSNGKMQSQRGFIVVAVLWVLGALSALVLIYLTYVTTTAAVVAGSTNRIQADALVTAGVELTAYRLTAIKQEVRPTSGTFDARLGPARISVTFRSEAARIDLNSAPKALLIGLITGFGVAASDAAGYVDHILAWRAPTELGEDDPENSFYRTSGATYLPRHAPFPAPEELWLVRGIPPLVIENMLPFVTVFSNLATINILDAEPQVVAALPGMAPENLQKVLAQRGDPALDPQSLLGLAGSGEGASLAASKAYRITIAVAFDNGRRTGAEAVILLLEGGDEPYRVLSWRNASDGGTAPQRVSLR